METFPCRALSGWSFTLSEESESQALWFMILDQDDSNHDANSNVFQIIRPFYTELILQLLLTVVDKELNGD